MKTIRFVPYTKEFLNLSWNWLNDPEIKALTNTPDFSKEIQHQWFKSLKSQANYKVWGIQYNDLKIGVVGLKHIEDLKAEYFGYIGEKSFWNSGTGRYMLEYASAYAKTNNIQELWLRVVKSNLRAIKAYEKFGFRIFHQTDNEYLMQLSVS